MENFIFFLYRCTRKGKKSNRRKDKEKEFFLINKKFPKQFFFMR